MKTGTDVGIESAGVTLFERRSDWHRAGGTTIAGYNGLARVRRTTSAFTVFEAVISNGCQRPNSPIKVRLARRFIKSIEPRRRSPSHRHIDRAPALRGDGSFNRLAR